MKSYMHNYNMQKFTGIMGILLFSALLVFCAGSRVRAACIDPPGAIDIVGSQATLEPGDIVRVPINVRNAYKPNFVNAVDATVDAFGFDVYYDTAVLDFIEFENGDLLINFPQPGMPGYMIDGMLNYNEYAEGIIRVGGFSVIDSIAPEEEGVLGYLIFSYLSDPQCTKLEFKDLVDDIEDWWSPPGYLFPAEDGGGPAEICGDGIDNNHDGLIDEGCALPDTGQTECYDRDGNVLTPCPAEGGDFYGQDAQYTINPPSYTKLDINGNELPDDNIIDWAMTRDNVTGLVWWPAKSQSFSCNWYDAWNVHIAGLNNAVYGGYSDWRLPTYKEMINILNYSKTSPALDAKFFPHMYFYTWTATDGNDPASAMTVRFVYGDSVAQGKAADNVAFAAAVRGGPVSPSFTNNGDGTVTDNNTGLMWAQDTADFNSDGILDDNDRMGWQDALDWCENLTLAGYDDWRLPNAKELASILDHEDHDFDIPDIDTTYFPDTVNSWGPGYKTSTTVKHYPDTAWLVWFYWGKPSYTGGSKDPLIKDYVRAVRNNVEICGDGIDNDKDGLIDEGCRTWYQDGDGDGYGNPAVSEVSINQPAGFVADNTDCDDTDAAINPGAVEACDGINNDCDGLVDEGCLTWYQDADGDGYGDPAVSATAIDQPAGFVADNTDCEDTDAAINPGAVEICGNGIDEDCSGADLACGGVNNLPPVADAGEDRIVSRNTTVALDGSGSVDPDDGIAVYLWEQTGGPAVSLSDPAAVGPSFTVPDAVGETLTFQLTVTDTFGAGDSDDVALVISEEGCNTQPDRPVLIAPEDGATGVSLTPTLTTAGYHDPGDCSTHFKTRWQISEQTDFSGLTYNANTFYDELTAHRVTKKVLKPRTTYYWRVYYQGDHGVRSEWSEVFSFTTGACGSCGRDGKCCDRDGNANGLPDDQEVGPDTDVNGNGIPDSQEANLRVLMTADGGSNIGLAFGADVLSVDMETLGGDEFDDLPGNFPYGLMAFRVELANPGATVSFTVYLPEAAPDNAVWYKYDTVNGWYDFTGQIAFSPDRKAVTFQLTDGGTGDADGAVNGVIVDPAGLATAAGSSGHGGGSSCFIGSCAF